MASLSLPRVLQLKKNSLDAEREQFEKFQTLAIQKAINSVETPVKEKHVRSTIIGTFQEQSAITYWMVAIRLPLQDNRIVAWKFCHVTHKLLREGHPACLDDSQRHIGMIENLGKLWVHLREGYGRLVHLYCALLVCKLRFHARNPRFPGNMHLTADELDAIAENDVNNYFQLCVELFDYLDDILNLQAAVFDSLGNARANSMTASGQCRLAALIPCAQDSSQIYDCNVRLLFRLHASLPADTLQGHRERFRQQFKKLSSFYKHASSLQYYRNLLSLPVLPSNPPNFLQQSDFGTYVTPVVTIPELPPDEPDAVGALIDTSDTMSQFSQSSTPEQFERDFEARESPPQPDPLLERDRLIEHLQGELKRMRSEVSQMVQERNTMIGSMREHCSRLETKLQSAKTELEEERQKAEILSVETPEIKQKLIETEEKAKVTDEKFQKLKGAYTQLREEHINLIRQKAEVDKMSATLRAAAAQHESAKVALQQQLNDKMKDVELLQQSASSSEEVEAYKNEIANLRSEQEQMRQKEVELENLRATIEALEIEHKTAKTESEEKINIINAELKEVKETLGSIKKEKEEREIELSRVKQELVGVREKSGEEYTKAVEERDAAKLEVVTLTEKYQQEKQEHERLVTNLQADLQTLQLKLTDVEAHFVTEHQKRIADITKQTKEFENILKQKDTDLKEALERLTNLEVEYEKYKEEGNREIKNKIEIVHVLEKEISVLKEQNVLISKEKNNNDAAIVTLEHEKYTLLDQFNENTIEKAELLEKYSELQNDLLGLQEKVAELENNEKKMKTDYNNNISELQVEVKLKDIKIQELNTELSHTKTETDNTTSDIENQVKECKQEIESLNFKMRSSLEGKEVIINDLKKILTEKDEKLIELSVEMKSFAHEVSKIEEELEERNAELEITKNELWNLKEEHESISHRNDANLVMKNDEMRKLHEDIRTLTVEKKTICDELVKLKLSSEENKQVYETKLNNLTTELESIRKELLNSQAETVDSKRELNKEIERLSLEYEQLKESKETQLQEINYKIETDEKTFKEELSRKETELNNEKLRFQELETKLNELIKVKEEEIQQLNSDITGKDRNEQMLTNRLQHVENEKLNAECELQDLLQHNTVLEDNVAALKRELEDARNEIRDQRRSIFRCAGDAALEVTAGALTCLERSSAQDSSRAAADLAARSLQELASYTEKEDVESAARAAILAAHNAAQLSAYVTDVSNTSTDMELSDKLTSQCRAMLQATRDCVQSPLGSSATEAGNQVRSLLQAASAADTSTGGGRSVDDELADMDRAIEMAAGQIEEMLAASRTGDAGVKLEVNGKILDACTTLMGAVKILVQDARKLQQELGDPKTRLNMYRRNPQWSEGLISAAKAVVFAAKLLVTSADEAVASSGRAEGVSAAAHEVAGSTAQLVAASRARAPPASPALGRLTLASRSVAAATGAVVAAVRAGSALLNEQEALDTSALTLTATRRLEMESKVRSLELETALDAERARLAALRKRHYQLAQQQENGNITNGKE